MVTLGTLLSLGLLQLTSPEGCHSMVSTAASQGLGVVLFWSTNQDSNGQDYIILDSLANTMQCLIHHQQFKVVGLPMNAHVSPRLRFTHPSARPSKGTMRCKPRAPESSEIQSTTGSRRWIQAAGGSVRGAVFLNQQNINKVPGK